MSNEELSKVYIVTDGDYEEYHICAVFSTEEQAQAYRKAIKANDVEEYTLNTPAMSWTITSVCMSKSGDVIKAWTDYPLLDCCNGFCRYDPEGNIICSFRTENEQLAIKSTNMIQVQMIAMDVWGDVRQSQQYRISNKNSKTIAEFLDMLRKVW